MEASLLGGCRFLDWLVTPEVFLGPRLDQGGRLEEEAAAGMSEHSTYFKFPPVRFKWGPTGRGDDFSWVLLGLGQLGFGRCLLPLYFFRQLVFHLGFSNSLVGSRGRGTLDVTLFDVTKCHITLRGQEDLH